MGASGVGMKASVESTERWIFIWSPSEEIAEHASADETEHASHNPDSRRSSQNRLIKKKCLIFRKLSIYIYIYSLYGKCIYWNLINLLLFIAIHCIRVFFSLIYLWSFFPLFTLDGAKVEHVFLWKSSWCDHLCRPHGLSGLEKSSITHFRTLVH